MAVIAMVILLLFLAQGIVLATWGTWWSAKSVRKELKTVRSLASTYWRLYWWGFVPLLGVIFIGLIVYVNQAPQEWLEGEDLASETGN